MSTQPFEQAVASARSVLSGVQSGQFSDPTPCASWDVKELINHIIGGQYFFAAGMAGSPPPSDAPDFAAGDYMDAFDEAASQATGAFGEDGALGRMVTMPFGEMPGMAVMGLATTDTFTHAWDLAKATGQDTDLAPELAAALLEQSKANIQDAFRGPEGAPFGPEQQAPDGASNADQLAAFLGRQV
jgi:uncharacterized protein (TIGR03086 family)